jgi:hypothetical protein
MVNVAPETARFALDAFDRYGNGRHPARPQFLGLCSSYRVHDGLPSVSDDDKATLLNIAISMRAASRGLQNGSSD